MKQYRSIAIASILALSAPAIAKAQLSITAEIGGVPAVSGATLETFDEPSPSILTLSGNAYLVTGENGSIAYVPPNFSGSTAAFFGESPANGLDTSQYVVVYDGGSATLSFPTPQSYLGILWGSVDPGNCLTFYDGANNVIGTVFGTDVLALTGDSGGDTGPNGTAYVNITSTTAFSRVVATYNSSSFEFDDVAYKNLLSTLPPTILSVNIIPAGNQNVSMSIQGSGFGTATAFNGTSPYLRIIDMTPHSPFGPWEAGYTGDKVNVNVVNWTDTNIVINGFTGFLFNTAPYSLQAGDQLAVIVENPQTESGYVTNTVALNQTYLEIDIHPSSNYPLVVSDNEMLALFTSINSQLQQQGFGSRGMIADVGPSGAGAFVDIAGALLIAIPAAFNDLANSPNLLELGTWGTAVSGADLGSTIATAWPSGVSWDPVLSVYYSAQYAVEAQYLQHSCFTSHVTSVVSQPRVDFAVCGTLNQLTIYLALSSRPPSTIDLQNMLGNWAWGIGDIPWNNPFSVEQLEETPCGQVGLTVNEFAYTTPGYSLYGYPQFVTANTLDFFGNDLHTNVLVPSGPPPLLITTSNSPALGGTNSGSIGAYSNSVVTVTATPNPGYSFSCWSENGFVVGLFPNYTFTATNNRMLVANFTTNVYAITTTNSPSDAGTTTGDTNTIYGTSITVAASANLGYSFAKWTMEDGTFVYSSSNYTFTVESNVVLVANYVSVGSSIITTVASPSFAGSTSGDGTYTNGQSETLAAAVTDSCYSFTNWTTNGIVCSVSPTNTITVTTNLVFVANFVPIVYNIAVSASAGGTASGSGSYSCGDTETLQATPNPCYSFVNWTENGGPVGGSPEFFFVVDTNHNVVANFVAVTNSVSTSSSPTSGGTTSGGGLVGCESNTTVNAVANSGYAFVNWTENGLIISTSSNYTFMPFGSQSLVANFMPNPLVLGFGSPVWNTNGLNLTLFGPIGSNYEVDFSTDLFTWFPSTNFLSTSSPFYFSVPTATNASQRFYRAVIP